ncbi:hypothetical protein ACVR1I_05695 [Streptococcus cameli]
MEDTLFRHEAIGLLRNLKDAFVKQYQDNADNRRFYQGLEDTLSDIVKKEKVDNTFLISLEKFHKRTCVLCGLSHFRFQGDAEKAWRAFDAFYYEQIQGQLRLYGVSGWA